MKIINRNDLIQILDDDDKATVMELFDAVATPVNSDSLKPTPGLYSGALAYPL